MVYVLAIQALRFMKRLVRRSAPGSLTVLCYHEVTHEQADAFAGQMELVTRLGTTVFADKPFPMAPGHNIAVTFDDGFVNLIDNALPLLQDRHIPCTLFLTTGDPGRTPSWLEGSDHPTAGLQLMTESQIQDLSLADIQIGSHSVSHPDLRTLTGEPLRRELKDSKARLERVVGRPVSLVAYPYGYFNPEVLTVSADVGYERAFTAEDVRETDDFLFSRIEVSPDDSPLTLRLKALGAYAWLPTALHLLSSLKAPLRRARRGSAC